MQVSDFKEVPDNEHFMQGQPVVRCNALYKSVDSFNCYLTAPQAIELARNLLMKAQLIVENSLEVGAVHVWNKGKRNGELRCGLHKAPKKVK